MAQRVLRNTRCVLTMPAITNPDGTITVIGGTPSAPITAPLTNLTTALLNSWVTVLSDANAAAGVGGNVSCGLLEDGLTLDLDASDTDDDLTLCDTGTSVLPTFYNVNAEFEFLRDADPAAAGVFNLAYNLFNAPDLEYVIVDRIKFGTTSTTPFEVGDVISAYHVLTDNLIENLDDQSNISATQTFVASGDNAVDFTLTA